MVARMNGRTVIREALGSYRSFASQAAHDCPEVDEEEFFRVVAEAFADGLKKEMSNIFGATKASRMLDPFKHNG